MIDLRGYKPGKAAATGSTRSKVIGAAVVALGLAVLGVYSFAAQDGPKPDNVRFDMANKLIMTTPDGAQPMPPPVEQSRRTPIPQQHTANDGMRQAAARPPVRMPPPDSLAVYDRLAERQNASRLPQDQ